MPFSRLRAHVPRALAVLTAAAVLAVVVPATATASDATTRVVATNGSDSNPGTLEAPFRTVQKGLTSLRAGDTLLVRGGTYAERITGAKLQPGTSAARITVANYPGERPVVQGLLWLKDASYWDLRGINVTWASSSSASEHMVKMTGGVGWTYTGSEIWGARSYAAVLVAGAASGWRFSYNHVHDTAPSNSTNQDHLIYVNSGTGGGIIERNLLVGSPNGRAVKVGPASATGAPVANLVIRFNTMVDNTGPSNVQVAWGTSNVETYRNIMVAPQAGRSAVTAYQLTGSGNVVRDNLGWATPRLADSGVLGLVDRGDNVLLDPQFADPARGDYRPRNSLAAGYGHLAGIASSGATREPVVEPVVEPAIVAPPTVVEPVTAEAEPKCKPGKSVPHRLSQLGCR